MLVGIVVGGLGSRLVMRLAAIAAGNGVQGMTTANGNRVGEITVGGTMALIILGGLFTGILGGLLYAALRPWLAPLGPWRGVVFGLGVLGLAGSQTLDSSNSDFIVLQPALLNVAMFAILFVLFGIALVPVFDRTFHALGDISIASGALAAVGVVLGILLLGAGLLSSLNDLASNPTTAEFIGPMTFGLVFAGLAAQAFGRRLASAPWRLATYGLLAAALIFGAAHTYRSVLTILT